MLSSSLSQMMCKRHFLGASYRYEQEHTYESNVEPNHAHNLKHPVTGEGVHGRIRAAHAAYVPHMCRTPCPMSWLTLNFGILYLVEIATSVCMHECIWTNECMDACYTEPDHVNHGT